jgi:SAM-dependent methyltransferase
VNTPSPEPHAEIDTSVASPARMYDYYLGGKDNFPADRNAAEQVIKAHPEQQRLARANRGFLIRAVRFVAEQGVDQFLDLGTGIPTSPNVHEVAREANPAARVVYVDNDPIVTAHNRALRATHDGVVPVHADVRDPAAILDHPDVRGTLDFDRPVALLAVAVFHFVPEAEQVLPVLRAALAPGSHLVLSMATTEGLTHTDVQAIEAAYAASSVEAVFRSRARIEAMFDGAALVEPGVAPVGSWRAHEADTYIRILGGVARL